VARASDFDVHEPLPDALATLQTISTLRQKEAFGDAENAIFYQKEDFDYADNETNHRAVAF
jgi:hypothetical protein